MVWSGRQQQMLATLWTSLLKRFSRGRTEEKQLSKGQCFQNASPLDPGMVPLPSQQKARAYQNVRS